MSAAPASPPAPPRPYDLFGYCQVAALLGCSERSVMRYARHHGLPVAYRFGRVVARRADVLAWEAAQIRHQSG